MPIRFLTAFLLLCAAGTASALPYEDENAPEGGGRFRFAQTYIGLEGELVTSGGRASLPGGASEAIPGRALGRFVIGALHFWGHADIFISIDLLEQQIAKSAATHSYTSGVLTGFHVYPWRLESGTVRPFVGASWAPTFYRQKNEGGEALGLSLQRFPLEAGLTMLMGPIAADLGVRWIHPVPATYYVGRGEAGQVTPPPLSFWAGAKWVFDLTVNAEQKEASGELARREAWRKSLGLLSGLGIGAGFSVAFPLAASSWHQREVPFLGETFDGVNHGDFALTLDIPEWRAAASLSWRPISHHTEAFGYEQRIDRNAIALEAMRYLFDFHGFNPFIGVTAGYERLRVRETDRGTSVHDRSADRFAPGLVFGWDILPTSTEAIVLRTNLRWIPGKFDMPKNTSLSLDTLEFDFIQVIIYPARFFFRDEAKD